MNIKRLFLKFIEFVLICSLLTLYSCSIVNNIHNAKKIIGTKIFSINKNKPLIHYLAPIEEVKKALSNYISVDIAHDISNLSSEDQMVLEKIIEASKYIQMIYYNQVYEKNELIYNQLINYIGTDKQPYYDLFIFMSGPWNIDNKNIPFINKSKKLQGANFYPVDITKNEFEDWILKHPHQKNQFISPFTMIRRDEKSIIAIPYVYYYKKYLEKSSELLKQAAEITKNESLKQYLIYRADEFVNYYYDMNRKSDIAWLDLNGDIELSIGPHEVYDDHLFEYKAGFHSFIGIVDKNESDKLQNLGALKKNIEQNFPIPDKYKKYKNSVRSPIKIVNEIYSLGLFRYYSPTAFNYPNDPWVKDNVGSKQIMIKNILKAKYEKISKPIALKILTNEDYPKVSFEGIFNIILLHEITHSLGPAFINIDGKEKTVGEFLKEQTWTIEECKADVVGMYNIMYLMKLKKKNPLPVNLNKSLFASYLIRLFRNIRFGAHTAHGRAVLLQLNFHKQNKGFIINNNGKYLINESELKKSIDSLAKKILMIQATGNKSLADNLIKKYSVETEEIKNALNRLNDIPIDINPKFPLIEKY